MVKYQEKFCRPLVATIVVSENGAILVGCRIDGRPTYPGGEQNFGETPREGAIRELFEEVGMRPLGTRTLKRLHREPFVFRLNDEVRQAHIFWGVRRFFYPDTPILRETCKHRWWAFLDFDDIVKLEDENLLPFPVITQSVLKAVYHNKY